MGSIGLKAVSDNPKSLSKKLINKKRKKHPVREKNNAKQLLSIFNFFGIDRRDSTTININPKENKWLSDPKIAKLTNVSEIKRW